MQESKLWCPDLGNGTFQNPILYADYSDPDVCRVGDTFYMTASSFNYIPGLPILETIKDTSDINNIKIKEQKAEKILYSTKVDNFCSSAAFRIKFNTDKVCQMYYKLENETEFTKIPFRTVPKNHSWVGAKLGIFSTALESCIPPGFADFIKVSVTAL